jgi:hypothetical protein
MRASDLALETELITACNHLFQLPGLPAKNVAARLFSSYLRTMTIVNRGVDLKFMFWFMLAALSATAQTNQVSVTNVASAVSSSGTQSFQRQTNQVPSIAERIQQIRAACIESRRSICGKILQVLPEGLVVDSGYTNLLRAPINRSWLVPGTVTASRAAGLVEGMEPDSVCVGLVFLTDIPKSRRLKPKAYDYVILEGYPTGRYTYTSVGNVQRTVRKFSAVLEKAVDLKLQTENTMPAPAVDVK